jgi:hypothetical protein
VAIPFSGGLKIAALLPSSGLQCAVDSRDDRCWWRELMTNTFRRRDFLKASAAFAGHLSKPDNR